MFRLTSPAGTVPTNFPAPHEPPGAHHTDDTPLVRLIVNVTAGSAAALTEAATLNDETRTDALNHAIQAYGFVSRMIAEGWELVLLDDAAHREQRLHFR
jgi:hypothetical protein